MNSFLGRCPACEQLVTLPAEARDREVSCPGCRHRARGVEFGAIQAPPAVILTPPAQSADRPGPSRRPARRAPPARAVPDDQARTHLVLDLPCEEDEVAEESTGKAEPAEAADAKTLLLGRIPPPARAQRAPSDDNERTHLLLDAAELAEEEDDDSSDHARTRLRLEGSDTGGTEERTHLQIGPLSLRTGDHSPVSRVVARLAWLLRALLRLSVWLEEALHGREAVVLAASALVCGFVAPGFDYLRTGSTLSGLTLVCQLLTLGALGVAQLNRLRDDEGKWDPRIALNRLRATAQLWRESLEHFAASARYVQWALVSRVLAFAGFVGLTWAAFLDVVWWLFGLPAGVSTLPFLNGILLLAAVLVERRARRLAPTPRFSLHDLGNSVAAAAALPPLVDLSDPLPDTVAEGGTALHRSLVALSRWRPHEWPDEAAYRAALERHLQRELPELPVERERWLGSSRIDGVIDLVVDGMLVIGVQRGADASAAQRALGQLRRSARAWSGKPMILAIFAAPGETALEMSTTAAWLELRKDCTLLCVRMPTY